MPFCANCGKQFPDNAKFCPECGTAIEKAQDDLRKQTFTGEVRKCPNCGEILSSFEAFCSSCGFELQNVNAATSAQVLSNKIAELEANRKLVITRNKDGTESINPNAVDATDKSIANIIRSHAVPNSKEEIFEFMTLAAANIDTKALFYIGWDSRKYLSKAWLAKFEQVFEKAKLSFGDHPDFQKIDALHTNVTEEIKRRRNRRHWWLRAGILLMVIVFAFLGVRTAKSVIAGMIAKSEGKIQPPASSEMIIGGNYSVIENRFKRAGFTDIQIESKEFDYYSVEEEGAVTQIFIDGDNEFSQNNYYSPDAKIVIYYCVKKELTPEAKAEHEQAVDEVIDFFHSLWK